MGPISIQLQEGGETRTTYHLSQGEYISPILLCNSRFNHFGDRHEIAGIAVRVGKVAAELAGIKVGDRVGVGAQIGSCNGCRACDIHRENYCRKKLETYVSLLGREGSVYALRMNHIVERPVPGWNFIPGRLRYCDSG